MELTRREWLTRLFPQAARTLSESAEAELERRFPRRRRPPGAVFEAEFLALCTRCGDCGRACPERAIYQFTGPALLANTPVLVPDRTPCKMCAGFPCASACRTGALGVPQESTVRLGVVSLDPSACIAMQGPDCGACAGLCPTQPAALQLARGKPVIDRDTCVGCGACITACVTSPAAIRLEPL